MRRQNQPAFFLRAAASVLVTCGVASGVAANPPSLETIIDRHTSARGGAAAIEAQRTVEIEIEITEPEFQVRGVWLGDRAGAMRIDVYDGEQRVFTEAWREGRAWQQTADGVVSIVTDAGARALRHGVELPTNLAGLHELEDRGARLELAPDERLEGRLHHVVRATLADGFEIDYLIDSESWMILRSRTRRAFHPDVDPTETTIETRYSDFRATDGVVRPFASTDMDLATGQELGRVRVLRVRPGITFPDGIFEPPSAGAEH